MPELNYAQLIQQQKSYFLTGETKTIAFRRKQLKKLRDAVLRNEELIYEALYKDLHKSPAFRLPVTRPAILKEMC